MGAWNLTSGANQILLLVPDVPDNVSGIMTDIVDRARENIQTYTGETISADSIDIKYQRALLCIAQVEVFQSMQLVGGDNTSVKLGDFSVKKGSDSNIANAITVAQNCAQHELNKLGFGTRFYKANG